MRSAKPANHLLFYASVWQFSLSGLCVSFILRFACVCVTGCICYNFLLNGGLSSSSVCRIYPVGSVWPIYFLFSCAYDLHLICVYMTSLDTLCGDLIFVCMRNVILSRRVCVTNLLSTPTCLWLALVFVLRVEFWFASVTNVMNATVWRMT